mmetsp:Transcript_87969/g.247170  ORF Transcript_87969/g.247170 Transcript_87969/m.247170 type:complete len:278 (+) Transcript_87969:467-1300(+)
MVDLDFLLSELRLRVVLGVAHGAILDRREDRRRDVGVIHELAGPAEKPFHQTPACLDGDGRQLGLTRNDVAHGVNVGHVGLLGLVALEFALFRYQACRRRVQPISATITANRQQHGVVDSVLLVFDEDLHLPRLGFLKLRRHHLLRELGAMLLHVCANHVRDGLIEATEENRSDHHRDVEPQACKEAGALQGDVGSADNKRLARRLFHPENVVGADATLLGAWVASIGRPAAACDKDVPRGDFFGVALLILELKRVLVDKGCEFVVVRHAFRAEVRF